MSLQAEGGDGDKDEEQRRKGNKLEEKKTEKTHVTCLIFWTLMFYTPAQDTCTEINPFIYSCSRDWTQTSLINLHQFEWTPERVAIY